MNRLRLLSIEWLAQNSAARLDARLPMIKGRTIHRTPAGFWDGLKRPVRDSPYLYSPPGSSDDGYANRAEHQRVDGRERGLFRAHVEP
jgi:hypothetical protein